MKQTVTFLHNCGEYLAGETQAIDARRARGLVMTGYARLVETADVEAQERADQVRPRVRGPKAEQRG